MFKNEFKTGRLKNRRALWRAEGIFRQTNNNSDTPNTKS